MTQDKQLHIICLDVPYPADYGGVFDIFYKLAPLHQAGVNIHLHCFEYGRGRQPALAQYCKSVHYYTRHEGHKGFSFQLPYIVCSRSSKPLRDRLLQDDFPILIEGIHCSFLLTDDRFKQRKIFLRLPNVEHAYYRNLGLNERSLFKKCYYHFESRLLKRYEKKIAAKTSVIGLARQDADYYRDVLHANDAKYLPAFLPYTEVQTRDENGCYCLYHGNLSVSENEAAVIWLLKFVFNDLALPFVIAGKNPSKKLHRLAEQHQSTCLVSNPSENEMNDIIRKAQVHILPSFNTTGVKLKLLNALYNGRHCVVNDEAVASTGLESLCHVASNAHECKTLIADLYEKRFGQSDVAERQRVLSREFDNEKNAKQLIAWIW